MIQMSYPFAMHLIIHMFHTSLISFISLDQYITPNVYNIPNMQNMRFFCCHHILNAHAQGHMIKDSNNQLYLDEIRPESTGMLKWQMRLRNNNIGSTHSIYDPFNIIYDAPHRRTLINSMMAKTNKSSCA